MEAKWDWSKGFIYDLKKLIRGTRRMGRRKSYLALTTSQRDNLVDTMQDAISSIKQVTDLCKPK